MLGELFLAGAALQGGRAKQAEAASEQAKRTAADARSRGESLRFDVEKLLMITEALWEILKREHGYTDDQLVEVIQEIDLRDGKLDGKVSRTTERPACSGCGRKIMRNQVKCLYCGAPVPQRPFER